MQQSIPVLFAAVHNRHGFRQHRLLRVPSVDDLDGHAGIIRAEFKRCFALWARPFARQRHDDQRGFPHRLIGQTYFQFNLRPVAKS